MVFAAQKSGILNTENNIDNSSGRRRRTMTFKLSFRKKKKSRYDTELTDSNHVHFDSRNSERVHGRMLSNAGKEDKPNKGILSKLFSFRKSRKNNSSSTVVNGDLNAKVRTKSLDLISDPITSGKKQENGLITNNLGHHVVAAQDDIEKRQRFIKADIEGTPGFSLSSPNLTLVEWNSYESFNEQDDNVKLKSRGSLRMSRASLVFPVSEIGSCVFNQLKHTTSEKHIASRRPNVNSTEMKYSKSCLPLDSTLQTSFNNNKKQVNTGENDIDFTVNKDVLKVSLVHRTPDGRSPHPGRKNVSTAGFSLPEIVENEIRARKVFEEKSTYDDINDKLNINTESNKRKQISASHSQHSIFTDTNASGNVERKGNAATKQLLIGGLKKHLNRYISCPGINEENSLFNEIEESEDAFIPIDSIHTRKVSSKACAAHQRPFSIHEGMTSSQSYSHYSSRQTHSVGDYHINEDESCSPMEEINLPSEDLPLAFAEALWDHSSDVKTELEFSAGEMIAVYFMNNQNWWWGTKENHKGWLPSSHVRLLVDQKLNDMPHENSGGIESGTSRRPRMPSFRYNTLSLLGLQDDTHNANDVRSRCLQELLSSEKDYVKTLRDVTEGYLKQAKRKPDMFKSEDSADFDIYSEYCNNHPSACARLLELQSDNRYKLFFESCRLLQQMISLSIDSFLLTPVQKICKYPLQLNELLKHTATDHADHEPLQAAVQVMRDVASSINERKRKFENLSNLAEWQLGLDNWQGNDLLEDSSQLIKRGILERLNGMRLEEVSLSLFDHQVIICKRESYKKGSQMLYEERLNLGSVNIEQSTEGSGASTKYLIKVRDNKDTISHIFLTSNIEERDSWIRALNKERQIVINEKKTGYSIPKSIRLAVMESARAKNTESKKVHRRRKSLTDPFQGFEFGANVIRRSFRLRRTQSLREKRTQKVSK
eukprot:gene11309-12491_t